MKKIDIAKENLCIKKIIAVIQGKIPSHQKFLSVNGRHSDAFVCVTSGSCTYHFADNTKFQVTVGDVFYLPHQAVYKMYIHTENYGSIFCDFEFLETEAKASALYASETHPGIDNLFVKLLNLYRASSCSAHTECMAVLYHIYSTLQQNAQPDYLGKSKEERIREARSYIDKNFHQPNFSISLLAEKIGISEVYLRKLFKAQYGITPSNYLISVRLENAKKLMRYPFITLEECALQSGFSSLQYFCRLFKKATGISPGKYKKVR